jgi:hypothetical protein
MPFIGPSSRASAASALPTLLPPHPRSCSIPACQALQTYTAIAPCSHANLPRRLFGGPSSHPLARHLHAAAPPSASTVSHPSEDSYNHVSQPQGPMQEPAKSKKPPANVTIRDVPNTSTAKTLSKYLSPRKLLEFRVNDSSVLGLVTVGIRAGMSGQEEMQVTSLDGQVHSVKPTQVAVVLPGNKYSMADLQDFEKHVRCLPHSDLIHRSNENFDKPIHGH